MKHPTCKIVVPVQAAAWMAGELGTSLERTLAHSLEGLPKLEVTRLPRAFRVESTEAPGPFLERVFRAVLDLEEAVGAAYPVLHHEMGPVWTGSLQAVFLAAPPRPLHPVAMAQPEPVAASA